MSTPAICYCGHARDAHELGVGACYLGAGPCVCGRFLMLERRAEPRVTPPSAYCAPRRAAGMAPESAAARLMSGALPRPMEERAAFMAATSYPAPALSAGELEKEIAPPPWNPPTPSPWALVTRHGGGEGYIFAAKRDSGYGMTSGRLAIVDNAAFPYARLMADAPNLLRLLRSLNAEYPKTLGHIIGPVLKPHESFEP